MLALDYIDYTRSHRGDTGAPSAYDSHGRCFLQMCESSISVSHDRRDVFISVSTLRPHHFGDLKI